MQHSEEVLDNGPKKPTKTQILHALKGDLKSADLLRQEMVTKVDDWRRQYDGKPYGNEVDNKSKIVSRDIKRQDEWQHASVKDPFVADQDIVKCTPITHEDVLAAQQNELILNYQFTRKFPRYKFMTDAIKLFYAEGTVISKCSWMYEDEEVTVDMPVFALDALTREPVITGMKQVKQLKVTKNQPHAQLCRVEDIYIDPTCEGDLDRAQFIIHRYESDMSTLKKSGKYKNLDKLRRRMHGDPEGDYDAEDDTEFRFKDEPRKKIMIYEYWGNFDVVGDGIARPIVCTWIDDVIIQLEDNPYPDKKLPFLIVANNSIPFKMHGEANAELIGDNQKVNTAIKRGIMDNMSNSNNAQKGIRVGALDPLNKRRFLNGKNFEFNGSVQSDFYDGNYNAIPPSVFSVLELTNNENESMLGVKSFAGGINGNTLGSTATASRGALDAVSVRRIDIVRNLAENLVKPLMRKWMSYNSEFLNEEEVIRITNEEFIPIRRDDLQGLVDIEIKVSTVEDNAAKARDLEFMLQTGQQTMDPGILKIMQAEVFRLKRMPDLAKKIEEYVPPPPDPLVQRMRELEVLKLESEIRERDSRALENQVDMDAKGAKADLDRAKTADLQSGKDLKDLEFTRRANGVEFQEKLAEKEAGKADKTASPGR